MCLVAGAVTKDYGVLACDSAMYDTEKGEASFESAKLYMGPKGIFSFIGSGLYLANMDRSKFQMPFSSTCLYLKEYLKAERPKVEEMMKEIKDEDEKRPDFCLLYLGYHQGKPCIAQFNSFLDFVPRYLWSDGDIRFSSIFYGDDSNPDKKHLFRDATSYMEMKSKSYEKLTPGIVGEILTRGIYHKADQEMKIGDKKKYAGGIVSAAMIDRNGVRSLSGFLGV